MKYNSKRTGRPRQTYKERSIKGFTPKGFKFHEYDPEKKAVVFKKDS